MLKLLLLPFAFLYGCVLHIRHFLYDRRLLTQVSFNFPVIVIGNLEAGGSGKTPHTIYITRLFRKFKPALLSRGYKRKTKGFLELPQHGQAEDYGDEPMLFKENFPGLHVAVCERRPEGIKKLKTLHPETGMVILDDAYQHRRLRAGCTILLVDWQTLQGSRRLLPAGKLRDLWSRRLKADLIVISKCMGLPDENAQKKALKTLAPRKNQAVFFSWYAYTSFIGLDGSVYPTEIISNQQLVMVCGIANPQYLAEWLSRKALTVEQELFPDHYAFTADDIRRIHKKFNTFATYFIITEKDRVKIEPLIPESSRKNWLSIQIEVQLNHPEAFENEIRKYVTTNSGNR